MGSSLNGTGVTFSNGSTQSVAWPGNTGTVTSVATGNGLSGGTITSTGTLVVACPAVDTVGAYTLINLGNGATQYANNATVSGASLGKSGSWRCMGGTTYFYTYSCGTQQLSVLGMFCRIS